MRPQAEPVGGGRGYKNGFVRSYSKLNDFLLPYYSRSWEGQQELLLLMKLKVHTYNTKMGKSEKGHSLSPLTKRHTIRIFQTVYS